MNSLHRIRTEYGWSPDTLRNAALVERIRDDIARQGYVLDPPAWSGVDPDGDGLWSDSPGARWYCTSGMHLVDYDETRSSIDPPLGRRECIGCADGIAVPVWAARPPAVDPGIIAAALAEVLNMHILLVPDELHVHGEVVLKNATHRLTVTADGGKPYDLDLAAFAHAVRRRLPESQPRSAP